MSQLPWKLAPGPGTQQRHSNMNGRAPEERFRCQREHLSWEIKSDTLWAVCKDGGQAAACAPVQTGCLCVSVPPRARVRLISLHSAPLAIQGVFTFSGTSTKFHSLNNRFVFSESRRLEAPVQGASKLDFRRHLSSWLLTVSHTTFPCCVWAERMSSLVSPRRTLIL